jgi:NAD(P)-dependent dehydrogenase (short-subunit alcohol dehydrogenase family)
MTTKKVVLVTGANKGIGYEVARQLTSNGLTVLLGSRDPQRGEAAAKTLRAENSEVYYVPLDVANEQSIKSAAELVAEGWEKLMYW